VKLVEPEKNAFVAVTVIVDTPIIYRAGILITPEPLSIEIPLAPEIDHDTGVDPLLSVAVATVTPPDVTSYGPAVPMPLRTGRTAELSVNVVLPEPAPFVAVTVIVTPLLTLDAATEITPVDPSILTPVPPETVHVMGYPVVFMVEALVTLAVGPVAALVVSIVCVPIELRTGLTTAPR
jgi:hypothetical protein